MATQKKTVLKSESVVTATKSKDTNSGANVLKLVKMCLLAAKTTLQSINELEKQVHETAIQCLKHAHDHGDVMPSDRLVKGLAELNHPATTKLSQEVVAWFRINSPVRWDAQSKPKQIKEGDEGFKPYDEVQAEETAFYDTPVAQKARMAADEAHRKSLKPVTFQDVMGRIKGLRKFVMNATTPDANGEVRGIAKGDKTKILKLIGTVEEAAGVLEETDKAA